jgi:hypothetical protein
MVKNLTDNSGNEDDPEIAALRKKHANKWSTYLSIIVVSGFFVWLLITNGNF